MYLINKIDHRITAIDDPVWENAPEAMISIANWPHLYPGGPNTTAKLLYDEYGIYVQMKTDETPIVAQEREPNGPVHLESCMEFFVRPNENDSRYMNFEFNAFGTMYFAVRYNRDLSVKPQVHKSLFDVQSYVDEDSWTLQFTIPFSYIDEVFGKHTKKMYGNLYKCGEITPVVHFLSYYPVATETPDFHRPEFFGEFCLG